MSMDLARLSRIQARAAVPFGREITGDIVTMGPYADPGEVLELCAALRNAWDDLERARATAAGLEQSHAGMRKAYDELQVALRELEGRLNGS